MLAAVGLALICAFSSVGSGSCPSARHHPKCGWQQIFIKERDGVDVKLTVTQRKALYIGLYNSKLSDVKAGQFIGATALPQLTAARRSARSHFP